MSEASAPYVNHCSRCGDGLLRLYRCGHCGTVVAICDECELVWQDIERVSRDPRTPADASFPACPGCGASSSTWIRLDTQAIRLAQLESHVRGESE
jgi:hypothetical protein